MTTHQITTFHWIKYAKHRHLWHYSNDYTDSSESDMKVLNDGLMEAGGSVLFWNIIE